jgi:serine/threonine protein kinase
MRVRLFLCFHLRQILVTVLTYSCSAVNLNHFRLLRVVGKGAFGKVRIVERKDTGLTFALKYIRKDEGLSESAEVMSSSDNS